MRFIGLDRPRDEPLAKFEDGQPSAYVDIAYDISAGGKHYIDLHGSCTIRYWTYASKTKKFLIRLVVLKKYAPSAATANELELIFDDAEITALRVEGDPDGDGSEGNALDDLGAVEGLWVGDKDVIFETSSSIRCIVACSAVRLEKIASLGSTT